MSISWPGYVVEKSVPDKRETTRLQVIRLEGAPEYLKDSSSGASERGHWVRGWGSRGRQGKDCADPWRSQSGLFLRANDHVISCDLQITSNNCLHGLYYSPPASRFNHMSSTWSFKFSQYNLSSQQLLQPVDTSAFSWSIRPLLSSPLIQFKFYGPHF